MQLSNLNSPPTEFYHPTNLDVQIAERNSAEFRKISKDDLFDTLWQKCSKYFSVFPFVLTLFAPSQK